MDNFATKKNWCEKCGAAMFVEIEGKVLPVPCICKQKEIEELQKQSFAEKAEKTREFCLPRTLHDWTFANDDGKDDEHKNIMQRYAQKFAELKIKGRGLLLWGDTGTGKTRYVVAIANELISQGYIVIYTTLTEVIDVAMGKETRLKAAQYFKADAIIIDDFGTERNTNFANEKVFDFINQCTLQNIPLLVTTNWSLKIIQDMSIVKDSSNLAQARICSRILERCYPICVNKIKRRAEKQQQNNSEMRDILGVGK